MKGSSKYAWTKDAIIVNESDRFTFRKRALLIANATLLDSGVYLVSKEPAPDEIICQFNVTVVESYLHDESTTNTIFTTMNNNFQFDIDNENFEMTQLKIVPSGRTIRLYCALKPHHSNINVSVEWFLNGIPFRSKDDRLYNEHVS